MALTQCRECGGDVSDEAFACPRCGAPFPWRKVWRGTGFDWRTRSTLWGLPVVHVSFGRDARGRMRVARGIIAVGQFAIGVVTLAQFGVAFLFGAGQFVVGPAVVAQFALALLFGLGQFSTGLVAVGQFAIGWYVLAHWGLARHAWSAVSQDPGAVDLFRRLGGLPRW